MKSKTKISKQLKRKNNSKLVETIIMAKKNKSWNQIAGFLSGPRRKRVCINLEDINKNSKDGDIVVVPGKILSKGEIDKKIKVVAFNFSGKAKEKLLSAGCEAKDILSEIKLNSGAKGIKIIK